jgi:PHD/YefM family antitoxin component YafN of YafNO toxin-antitoxin module
MDIKTFEEIDQLCSKLKKRNPNAVVLISQKYTEMEQIDDEIDERITRRREIIQEIEDLIQEIPSPKIKAKKAKKPRKNN